MVENKAIKKIDSIITVALVIATTSTIILGGVVFHGSAYASNISDSKELEVEYERKVVETTKENFVVEDPSVDIGVSEYGATADNTELIPLGEFKITAFTAGYESTGKTPDHPAYGITASGKKVKENHTIASDWDMLPPGTVVYIQDVGIRTVEDRGGKVKGNHIDLYIPALNEALDWGVQYRDVWLVKYKEGYQE